MISDHDDDDIVSTFLRLCIVKVRSQVTARVNARQRVLHIHEPTNQSPSQIHIIINT